MMKKPHTAIKSVSPMFVAQVAREFGPPDNFVESAEATFAGLPCLDSDPDAQRVMANLEGSLNEKACQTIGRAVIKDGVSLGE